MLVLVPKCTYPDPMTIDADTPAWIIIIIELQIETPAYLYFLQNFDSLYIFENTRHRNLEFALCSNYVLLSRKQFLYLLALACSGCTDRALLYKVLPLCTKMSQPPDPERLNPACTPRNIDQCIIEYRAMH